MAARRAGRVGKTLREKTPEKIHPKTLVVTGLTAVTVATVSLKLAKTVNPALLVGMATLLTAFISEFYRVSLELFQRTVRRQVNRILERSEVMLAATGEIAVINEAPKAVVQGPEEAPTRQIAFTPFGLRRRTIALLNSRWGVPAFFALIAFAIVGTSFAAGQLSAETPPPQRVENRSVTQIKDLSQQRMKELEQAATAKASEAAKEAAQTEANSAVAEANASSEELVKLTKEQLVTLIGKLRKDLEAEQKLSQAQGVTLSAQEKRIKTLEDTLTALETQMTLLQAQVDAQSQPDSTPAPTP